MSCFKLIWLIPLIVTLDSCNQNKQPEPAKNRQTYIQQKQLPLWTGSIPDSGIIKGKETYHNGMVTNVSNPTITIYSPQENNTGAAVIVFPGGGYKKVAVELEGSEICEWLTSIGVTGILLKYRVPDSGPHHDDSCDCQVDAVKPLALEDAQRATGLVRLHAKEWNIDPHKIGVMGFSAGGHLVADISNNYQRRSYPVSDDADKESCRPDFGIAFFPGHMLFHTDQPYELNSTIPVTGNTPPTFILQAGNDPVDTIQNSLVYYIALKKAGVHAEYHIYAEGGHAFGLHTSQGIPDWDKLPIAEWTRLVKRWLHTINMIPSHEE